MTTGTTRPAVGGRACPRVGALLAAMTACGPDLPPAWEGADPVPDLVQRPCSGSPYEGFDERVDVTSGAGRVEVALRETPFRCAQDVEAFARRRERSLDLLVQPIDMHPSVVAGCDCLYDIDLTVHDVPSGGLTVSVWRRWDALNEPNDPIEVGSAAVTVP